MTMLDPTEAYFNILKLCRDEGEVPHWERYSEVRNRYLYRWRYRFPSILVSVLNYDDYHSRLRVLYPNARFCIIAGYGEGRKSGQYNHCEWLGIPMTETDFVELALRIP